MKNKETIVKTAKKKAKVKRTAKKVKAAKKKVVKKKAKKVAAKKAKASRPKAKKPAPKKVDIIVESPPYRMASPSQDGDPIADGKRVAYTAVIEDGEHRLGIAAKDEAGYYRVRKDSDAGAPFATHAEAVAAAEAYNERLGLSKLEAGEIVLSSVGKQMQEEIRRPADAGYEEWRSLFSSSPDKAVKDESGDQDSDTP